MNTEKEDLDALLTHPGWLRVDRYAREYWSGQISEMVAHAANDRDDTQALNKLRQIVAAKRAVESLLAWPKERIGQMERRAERSHETVTDFAGPTRRGSL